MNSGNISKPKLLRLTNCIMHYSIPTYNMLSEHFDLTVAHYGEKVEEEKVFFKQLILSPKKIGPFTIFKENIFQLARKYDAVIALGDLHILPYIALGFRPNRKFALTFWGIGVSASYNKKFDEDRSLDWIRFRIMNKADSLVFYSDYPVKRYVDKGVKREKLFVAHNTIFIEKRIDILKDKNYFLFIGTLYKEKKIYDLLDAYLMAFKKSKNLKTLIIVGDGKERKNIEIWISENNLQNNIILKGAIFNPRTLEGIYKYAMATISPGQAGLSVLSSMANGVPFITTDDAITGGERFNIAHGYNGLFYDGQVESLALLIESLNSNIKAVLKMGQNAQDYYFKHRTMDKMILEIIHSINYAIRSRN